MFNKVQFNKRENLTYNYVYYNSCLSCNVSLDSIENASIDFDAS